MLEWIVLVAAVLMTAPVRLSLRVDVSERPSFFANVNVYGVCVRLQGPITEKTVRDWYLARETPLRLSLRDMLLFLYHLFLGAQRRDASAACRVGTGDACATALTAGALRAILHGLAQSMGMAVEVKPEFGRPFFALSFRCILCFRGGDIIRAAGRAYVERPRNGR